MRSDQFASDESNRTVSEHLREIRQSRYELKLKWSVPNLRSGYGSDSRPVLKCPHENSTKETNMTTQFKTKRASQTLFIILIAVCCGAILTPVHAQKPEAMKAKSQYQVSTSLGLAERVTGETVLMIRAGWQAMPGCRIGTGTLRCGETVCSPTSAHLADQTAVSHGT